jgi:hypothetical protein
MDNSLNRKGFDAQQKSGFLARTWILGRLFNWLADLLKVTEGEREDAGIYFGPPGR